MSANTKTILAFMVLFSLNASNASTLLDVDVISEKINRLAEDSLGVAAIQEHFNSLPFQNFPLNGNILITQLRDSVHEVFQSGVTAITSLQAAVKKSLQSPSQIANNECCQLNVNDLTYSTRFGKPISENYACERISPTVTDDPERLSNDVVTVMKENNRQIPQIKWQYYGTEQGMMTIYPANKQNGCDIYDNRYRPWYVETKSPHPKNIVIVLDNSGSMRQNHGGRTLMEFAKESIKTVLYTLNPNDKVSVISFSDAVRLPIGSGRPECFGERLAQATPLNIDHLNDFLQSLPIDDSTKYLAALNTSFDLLIASRPTNGENRDQVILFVTDGKPDDDMAVSSTDSVEYVRNAAILKMIIDRNNEMGNKVSIFTYGLGSDVDSDLLEAMATQNGSAYGISPQISSTIVTGQATLVTRPEELRNKITSYNDYYTNTQNNETTFSVPYQGASGIGLTITVSIPVIHNSVLHGILGISITLDDIFADVTYFGQGHLSYAFMFEVSPRFTGRTLIHPLFPAPDALEEDPVFVHITSLERSDEFKTILSKSIADGKNFEIMAVSFISTRSIARGDSATEGVLTTKLPSKYYCKAVGGGIPYVVCAVIADEDRQTKLGSYTPTGNDFMYHRIDILAPESRCRIRNKTATTDHSTVKFSPDAFRDPKYYISNEEDINIVQLYTQYMNDITGHIPSDLFKESVRAAVVATAITEEIWKNASQYDSRQFITAYFIGTDNGVFRIFPGQQLGNSYDHATRPWYKRVKGNVNKHTLSIPYNDDFENDYVITLSHTIVESSISDQATSDEIRAVVGIDFTVEYFHLLVTDGYPQCVENQYSCFVMDSSGYLVIHNDFIEANGDINIENLHITEIEPDIARDLISKGVLIKSQCVNFQTIKQQNYYIAERRSDIDNLADSDSCMRYQLSYISGTNVYLGIINKDDCPETRETKCICESQCRDTENTECECPCLSDAVYDYCNDEFHYTSDSHPACTPKIRDLNIITQAESDVSHLSQCFETHCSEKQNAVECNAAVNCEWCMDGSPRCEDSVYHCKPPHVSSGLSTGIKTGIAISVLAAIGIIIVVIVFIVVRHHREANVLDYIDKYTDNEYDVPSAPPKPSDATPAEEDTLNYELAEDYILPDTHDSNYVYHNHEHDSD